MWQGLLTCVLLGSTVPHGGTWTRHTIDDSSRGADGVRLADVNGDGHPDIATGWEEAGITRLYINPGPDKVAGAWPAVTVGKAPSVEDAVLVDLDGDGAMDVVSCTEGRSKTIFVHWAPAKATDLLEASAWKTEAIPATRKQQAWMFALPMDVDGQHGIDLVVGSKGTGGSVGWLASPKNPRKLDDWVFHKICDAGWIMSLRQFRRSPGDPSTVLVSDR